MRDSTHHSAIPSSVVRRSVLALALLVGCSSTPAAPDPQPVAADTPSKAANKEAPPSNLGKPGQTAHLFFQSTENPKLSGVERFKLGDHVGDEATTPRPVVLSFAAWYCEPCKKELADYARSPASIRDTGAEYVVVVIGDKAEQEKMTKLVVDELQLPFPVVRDWGEIVARRYGVTSLPHTVVVGRDGKIASVVTGYDPKAALGELVQAIAAAP